MLVPGADAALRQRLRRVGVPALREAPAVTARPEARLEREILRALGSEPDVLLLKNEVGQGYHGALRPALERALGPYVSADAMRLLVETLARHRVAFGAGVGSPDLLAVAGGVFAGLELKSATGRTSPEQDTWHAAARARGCIVQVVRSVEEARDVIQRARERGWQ